MLEDARSVLMNKGSTVKKDAHDARLVSYECESQPSIPGKAMLSPGHTPIKTQLSMSPQQ
jgi:hypothetical protein